MPNHPVPGSDRQPLHGARAVGKVNDDERLEVTVMMRGAADSGLQAHLATMSQTAIPVAPISREAFAAQYGSSAADMDAVKRFATAQNLQIVQENAARRTIILAGTAVQLCGAFGVELEHYEFDGGSYRGRTGSVHIPDELKDIVTAVLGLDNRPQAEAHFRLRSVGDPEQGRFQDNAAATSYTPVQIADLYNFPAGDGAGECVAIIELGGGYKPADLKAYFAGLGITTPSVTSVSVDHATNAPTGSGSGPDGEVMLDIEVVGAIAPKAKIVVYFAPNTDAGFVDAITTAIHDTTNKPSVISISWGGPESSWTTQATSQFDQAFQAAAAMGVTICAASGDNGSSDGVTDGADHVDFPASSPHVLACGGTNLQGSGTSISQETVWNNGANGGAGGGGISALFPVPAWQQGLAATKGGTTVPLTNRGVPDIAGDADPESGYQVRVDGQDTVIGGTSAVAPLWAGLIARINAAKGSPVGFVNPLLYQNAASLRDITQGNNGDFSAAPGWDACTGLGSPDGKKVAAALGASAAASA